MMKLLSCLGLFVSLALSAGAQATIKMKDGSTVKGHATRYDSPARTLYFTADDGRELVLELDDLDALTVYQVNRSIAPKDDAERQLAVANFARDIELFAHSKRHYDYALKAADASFKPTVEKELATAYQRAAAYALNQAQEALKKGDRKEAEKWLEKILLKMPNEPQAAEAARMLKGLTQEADDDLETKSPELLTTDLEKGKKYYDSMIDENNEGLVASNGSQAKRHFDKAIKDGTKALKEIDTVAKKRTDSSSQGTLAGYRTLVTEKIIEIHLNIASQEMTQSSYNAALQAVNQALALDNRNSTALAMRARIEDAASRGLDIF